MSKFAMILALMALTAGGAYCLYSFPSTDTRFIYAAYGLGAAAVLMVFVEFFHVIILGFQGMSQRRQAKKIAKATAYNASTRRVDPVEPVALPETQSTTNSVG